MGSGRAVRPARVDRRNLDRGRRRCAARPAAFPWSMDLDLIVVDYLQLVQGSRRGRGPEKQDHGDQRDLPIPEGPGW